MKAKLLVSSVKLCQTSPNNAFGSSFALFKPERSNRHHFEALRLDQRKTLP
jgi:hypothetical protein